MMDKKNLDYLRACDKQGREFPVESDDPGLKKAVDELTKELSSALAGNARSQFNSQDCTFYAQIRLPIVINARGDECNLYVSNFGRMLAIQDEKHVGKKSVAIIKEAAERNGFRWFSEDDLLNNYDGSGFPGLSTWWHRFFDYI